MFTAKFRDCRRSFLSEAPLVGGLVKGGRFVGLELEKSPRALVAANAHGASISPGVQPISQFTGILPDAAQPRGFSHAPGINVAQGESVRDLFREVRRDKDAICQIYPSRPCLSTQSAVSSV